MMEPDAFDREIAEALKFYERHYYCVCSFHLTPSTGVKQVIGPSSFPLKCRYSRTMRAASIIQERSARSIAIYGKQLAVRFARMRRL